MALLAENVAHPKHEFWPDGLQVPAAVRGLDATLQGYRQLTDAYLLALAHRRKGVLATFDRGLRALAGESFGTALEIVPTRSRAAHLPQTVLYRTCNISSCPYTASVRQSGLSRKLKTGHEPS